MNIWQSFQYLFLHWDSLVPKWLKCAIALFVYGTIGYSLSQIFTKWNSDKIFYFELRQGWQWLISIAFLLVGANWYTEVIKWRKLVLLTVHMERIQSIRAVLYGTSLGLISPNRIGDFSGRSLFLPSALRKEGASATIVSSICQNIPTFLCGTIACLALYIQHIIPDYDALLLGGVAAGFTGTILFALLIKKTALVSKWCQKVHFSAGQRYFDALSQRYPQAILNMCLGLSFFRYSVFIVQFWLIAGIFSNVSIVQSFIAMAIAYLTNAIIPSNQLVELGIRVAVPVFILSHYAVGPVVVAVASSVLWFINLAIPSLVGAFMYPRGNE